MPRQPEEDKNDKVGLPVEKPVSIWHKPVTLNVKALFKALGKAAAGLGTGKWDSALKDGFDVLDAFGLEEDSPSQLAWRLIHNAFLRALRDLVQDNYDFFQTDAQNIDRLSKEIEDSLQDTELRLERSFFERPDRVEALDAVKAAFIAWAKIYNASDAQAQAMANRLNSYFVFALNEEWRGNNQTYEPLKEALDTPFTRAGEREQGWLRYHAWLQKQVDERMFDEAFSLQQVYIPLRAYYERRAKREATDTERSVGRDEQKKERIVVMLEDELDAWLRKSDKDDAIRVISGGPGSGKSSFVKMFAARHAARGAVPVLFVPLYHFELTGDLVEAVGEFVRPDPYLIDNPLDPKRGEDPLLIIFDGLDELAMQGRVASELVAWFVDEVGRKVSHFNQRKARLLVLMSGRTLVVQERETDFRRTGQVLELLPYFVAKEERETGGFRQPYQYIDEQNLLEVDQRDHWWERYGKASGLGYTAMPEELKRNNLVDITSQPLLNYLVALSYTRGRLDFTKENNLNTVYYDLLHSVYERAWAKGQPHPSVKGLEFGEFVRVLEEIGLATWHGDGRTTTEEEIQRRCRQGLRPIYEKFQEGVEKGAQEGVEKGAKAGITRLLTAFYFSRVKGGTQSGRTFEFTHKTFGEYLAARRIVRALELMHDELERSKTGFDRGWNETEALEHWAELCGPAAIDRYLLEFLRNEVAQHETDTVASWQQMLCDLISFMLRHGMPMHALGLSSYQEMTVHALNAEEALLAALSSCALATSKVSQIDWPNHQAFGAWYSRLNGWPRVIGSFARLCLNHLNLSQQHLAFVDLSSTDLSGAYLIGANLSRAYLSEAELSGAELSGAELSGAELSGANLSRAYLSGATWINGNKCKEGSIGECIQDDE
jgi:hypothetical protein